MSVAFKRCYELDIIRVLACLMVVAMHSPMPGEQANGTFLASLSYLTAPCIGLFFMVSGALLLPVNGGGKMFINNRLRKVVLPVFFWSMFYIVCNQYRDGAMLFVWKEILSIPFSPQGNGVLWFMYTLTGLYLVAPIISRWLESASLDELELYLLLWLVSMCYPLLELFLEINKGTTGVLYYCSGFIGYFVLGYYLRKYPDRISRSLLIPSCIIALVVPLACKLFNWKVDFYSMFWYLSVFVLVFCVAWFKGILSYGSKWVCNERIRSFIVLFSNLSFGIYLIHIFVMRYILWNMDWLKGMKPYIAQSGTIFLLTTVISFALVYLISRFKYAQYIIGYKSVIKK